MNMDGIHMHSKLAISNRPVPSNTNESEQPGTLNPVGNFTLVPGSKTNSALPTASKDSNSK